MAEALKREDQELTPREYQSLLLETCKKQNTILYLPTGTGKTYIAVMLIKHMSGDLGGKIQEGGKRTFFMVNTVALVSQQAAYLSRHTPLSVGQFSGDMNLDFWKKPKWEAQLNQYEVIVMTVEIFKNILLHNYISLRNVNLLVFDECHHAVSDHSMAQVMMEFSGCPVEEQPRVVGLTATILNSDCTLDKVKTEVRNLEKTYRSTVVTVEDSALISKHATAPKEMLCMYLEANPHPLAQIVIADIDSIINFILACSLDMNMSSLHVPVGTRPLIDFIKSNKKLKNIMIDVTYHVQHLGIYGGSIAAMKHILQLERIRRTADDVKMSYILHAMIFCLTAVRKRLEDHMSECDEKSRIYKYSTVKVIKLLDILRDIKPAPGEDVFGIVFVERRFTAKVLYLILKYLAKRDEDFSFLKPDFIVGFQNNPFNCTREGALEKKWNEEALHRFRTGQTNLIVSSDVLEEGIDVAQCNLVVKFDLPKSYRSYIQSKGRARKRPSKYAMMISDTEARSFKAKYSIYQQIEAYLKKILTTGNKENDLMLDDDDIEGEDESDTEAYYVDKEGISSKVTMRSAIALVNRYCSVLPHDNFTTLTPVFFLKLNVENIGIDKCQCILQLPINSPVKDMIEGDPKRTKKLAKQSVALKTCKVLHQAGELNDHLIPQGRKSSALVDPSLFPNWENEAKTLPRPGTKKKKRIHTKQVPDSFCKCAPQAGVPVYLHVIEMTPAYQRPPLDDSRRSAFYSLLDSNLELAILSSKEILRIPDFPIFLNVGQVDVHVRRNSQQLILTEEEIFKLKKFNTMIFHDVLELCQSFMIVDFHNNENAYFIVPSKSDASGAYNIDWATVFSHQEVPAVTTPTEEARANIKVTPELYNFAVLTPWYRSHSSGQRYIVTKICNDKTPLSDFPTEEFTSFEHYYEAKYNLSVMNLEQPLVEVKAISSRLNCLKPRGRIGHSTSKRRRQEMHEDFEEHFIPELCHRYAFPAVLWLKSTCLPSILHRITHLLLAEELRLRIAQDLRFVLRGDMKFEPLAVDPICLEANEPSSNTAQASTIIVPPLIQLKEYFCQNSEPYPWGDEPEPVDIDREFLEDITLMDVFLYDDFISKPLTSKPGKDNSDVVGINDTVGVNDDAAPGRPQKRWSKWFSSDTFKPCPAPIHILDVALYDLGPQPCQIMQALTAASANDIFDMERLETLGDTFLKFSASLYLFLSYPNVDEGKLTEVKGKMVGNRNLYYCGKARGICNILKVQDFSPRNDWTPPGFCVPLELKGYFKNLDKNLCPSLLYEVNIPQEDKLNGILSPEYFNKLQAQMSEWDRENTFASCAESYVGEQVIADKTVADAVEALLGTYLSSYGVEGGAKLLGWFNIIPPEKVDIQEMYFGPPVTAYVATPSNRPENVYFHLKHSEIQKLEAILGYHFRDHSFLLQALTHPSYVQNRVTDCYQRLEFLGDAILDFLITCHIFETCGNLSPGQITDLRSALVNNITFGCLAVRYDFHTFCKYESAKLFEMIDLFVKYQEKHDHEVNEKVLYLLEESDCHLAEYIDVPKVLGDIFESLAAAVYLDSGKSLKEVWKVVYRLMKNELDKFSKCVPKQPVRMLYERCPSIHFKESKQLPDCDVVMVELEVSFGNQRKYYHGFGNNKSNAKRAAAKMALKEFRDSGY